MSQLIRNFIKSIKTYFTTADIKNIPKACFLYYARLDKSAILYREAKALKDKGFEVDIICLKQSTKETPQAFDGLNLHYIQSRPSSEKRITKYFLRLFLFYIKSIIALNYLWFVKKYDIIHITSPPDIIVFTAIIPKLFGAKIILDIHDIGPELYMRKLNASENHLTIRILKYLEKISCRFADHVITVTDLWKEKLIKRSVSSSKCSVLLNVPDEDIFKVSAMRKKQILDSFNLFYHGSLEEHFGVDTLLKAMPIIKEHIPNAALHIYGGGRLLEEFKILAENLNIKEYVHFFDGVPFYQLPEILSDADLGIVPTKNSVFSDEAVSMKSFEYLSLGIPIVISKTKAHSYYYNSSMVKFFNPEDGKDLALSVAELYKDAEERKRLACNAQTFIKTYGWNQTKKTYYEIIDRLMSN